MRNALFKNSRLDLSLQTLKQNRLISFEIIQAVNRDRQQIERQIDHHRRGEQRKQPDRTEHLYPAHAACTQRDDLAVTRQPTHSRQYSDQQRNRKREYQNPGNQRSKNSAECFHRQAIARINNQQLRKPARLMSKYDGGENEYADQNVRNNFAKKVPVYQAKHRG